MFAREAIVHLDPSSGTQRRSYSLRTCGRVVGYSSIATIGLRPPPDHMGRQKGCKVRIARHSTAIGWFLPQRRAGVLTLSAVVGGFHVRMEAPAALAWSFHRRTFTPITRSHSIANPSTMRAEARL
jgi:hypothetical protein